MKKLTAILIGLFASVAMTFGQDNVIKTTNSDANGVDSVDTNVSYNSSFNMNDEIKLEDLGDGVKRKVLSYSKNIMLVEVYFEKDAIGKPHKHIHEQINYVKKGSFKVTIDGVTKIVKENDAMYIAPNVIHSCVALEEGVLLNVFTPRREEFLK